MGWAHTGAEGAGRGQGRSWGLGTGLGILNRDMGNRGRDTESRKEPWGASSEKKRTTWKGKQGCPVLPGTGTEGERGPGNGKAGHKLRSANRWISHCRKVTENPSSTGPSELQRAQWNDIYMLRTLLFLPRKRVKSSCQWGGNGRARGSGPSVWPWAVAQSPGCVAQVMLLGTASSGPGSLLGTGAPLRGPSLRTHPAEPTASKMAHRCPLFEGIKDPSYKTSHPSVKSQCPHRWEACRWEKLGF